MGGHETPQGGSLGRLSRDDQSCQKWFPDALILADYLNLVAGVKAKGFGVVRLAAQMGTCGDNHVLWAGLCERRSLLAKEPDRRGGKKERALATGGFLNRT